MEYAGFAVRLNAGQAPFAYTLAPPPPPPPDTAGGATAAPLIRPRGEQEGTTPAASTTAAAAAAAYAAPVLPDAGADPCLLLTGEGQLEVPFPRPVRLAGSGHATLELLVRVDARPAEGQAFFLMGCSGACCMSRVSFESARRACMHGRHALPPYNNVPPQPNAHTHGGQTSASSSPTPASSLSTTPRAPPAPRSRPAAPRCPPPMTARRGRTTTTNSRSRSSACSCPWGSGRSWPWCSGAAPRHPRPARAAATATCWCTGMGSWWRPPPRPTSRCVGVFFPLSLA